MLIKYFIIIFIQSLISYFSFRYYYKLSIIKITNDEFTFFERGKVVSGSGIVFIIIFLFFFFYLFIYF